MRLNSYNKAVTLLGVSMLLLLGIACGFKRSLGNTQAKNPLILSKSTQFKPKENLYRRGDVIEVKAHFKTKKLILEDKYITSNANIIYYVNGESQGHYKNRETMFLKTNFLDEGVYHVSANLLYGMKQVSAAQLGSFYLTNNNEPLLENFQIDEAIYQSGNLFKVPYGELNISAEYHDDDLKEIMFYKRSSINRPFTLVGKSDSKQANTKIKYNLNDWIELNQLHLMVQARDSYGVTKNNHFYTLELDDIERVKINLLLEEDNHEVFLTHDCEHEHKCHRSSSD